MFLLNTPLTERCVTDFEAVSICSVNGAREMCNVPISGLKYKDLLHMFPCSSTASTETQARLALHCMNLNCLTFLHGLPCRHHCRAREDSSCPSMQVARNALAHRRMHVVKCCSFDSFTHPNSKRRQLRVQYSAWLETLTRAEHCAHHIPTQHMRT